MIEWMSEMQRNTAALGTYISSSKHMEGPTTLAAPLLILKAKKFFRQALLSPHLNFGVSGKGTQHSHRGSIWGRGLGLEVFFISGHCQASTNCIKMYRTLAGGLDTPELIWRLPN